MNPLAQAPVGQDADTQPGVEVQARGPVHEAFATPTAESKATPAIPRKPPAALEELPPEEKPEGDVVWIGGYWAWDDDRQDFLWVSGCWRTKPASREWVPGYWREQGTGWQWVSGFWALSQDNQATEVTYHPEPPPPPKIVQPTEPPAADMFYVPGNWVWVDTHYVWRAGYWTRARTGYVYVPAHYRWSPYGYVFVGGYWDLSLPRRGLLYAPVVIDPVLVGPTFVYTPAYAVTDTIVLDTLFVRPVYGHYYFGDYYGPRYSSLGFESCVVYSRRHYDAVIVYHRWEHRHNPRWMDLQVNLCFDRHAGRAPLPPRTLVQQRNITNVTNVRNVTNVTNVTNVNNVNNVLAPTKSVVANRGGKTVAVDSTARLQAKQHSQAHQHAAIQQRRTTEAAHPTPGNNKPHTASMKVHSPPNHPGGEKNLTGKAPGPLNPHKGPAGFTPLTTKGPALGGPDNKNPSTFKPALTDPGKKPLAKLPPMGPPNDPPRVRPNDPPRFSPPPGKNRPPENTKKKN